ncbi:MAG: SDR family oxidoreductase [Pseudomonadales bacterium]|nr:SDR family oxidoreductase [Pseudomonadales bacterium]
MLEALRLDGRAAVVTGSGRGLGKAMAKALAAAGASVVCSARTQEQIDQTVAEIEADGGNAIAQACDVTDSGAVDALVDRCVDTFGKLDIMISNAGGGGVRGNWEFWEYPDDAFESVLATNLKSNFYCSRAAARHMVHRGEGGVIIHTASGTALRGNRSFAYPTAKGGQISLMKSTATMLAPHNIRVNTIIPGFVAQREAQSDEEREVRRQRGIRIPVRRLGEWWELGPLAVYLASDASSYVTGQSFIIDGGGLAGGLGPVEFVPHHEIAL